jgi:mannose-6-phosphate isomerase-like protein (cupin superfamily)
MTKADRYLEIGQRPWGRYFVMEDEEKFKVKKLEVLPGKRLSLQSHERRSEHWVVVSGIATLEVQVGDKENWIKEYKPNEYCYIPKQAKHRISNNQEDILIIIEVQCGDYTGEDDIIRYEDDFGRN